MQCVVLFKDTLCTIVFQCCFDTSERRVIASNSSGRCAGGSRSGEADAHVITPRSIPRRTSLLSGSRSRNPREVRLNRSIHRKYPTTCRRPRASRFYGSPAVRNHVSLVNLACILPVSCSAPSYRPGTVSSCYVDSYVTSVLARSARC